MKKKVAKIMFLKSNQDHKEGVNVLKHNKGVYSTGHAEGKYASHRSEAAETGHLLEKTSIQGKNLLINHEEVFELEKFYILKIILIFSTSTAC